jgi:predicted enzyme related to lactoylglutathione lyase
MAKVAYYEIQVDNFVRAQAFYGTIFDWKFSKMEAPFEYYMINSGPDDEKGIDGGMLQRQNSLTAGNGISAFVCTIYVTSIDETLEKVTQNGGSVAMPKTHLEGVGDFAYAVDTEGNTFGIWEK